MGTHFAWGRSWFGWRSPAPTPTTWLANKERGCCTALHCTALRCAARKIREIHAPLLLVLLLDVACWLLAAVIWITDRSSCSLVSVYAMMGPAVHWRGFAYPAPRGRTRSGASLLAFPECLSIMSSVSCFLSAPHQMLFVMPILPSQVRFLQLPLVPYPISQVHRCLSRYPLLISLIPPLH
jgi:hypothetical protein